MTDVGDVTLDVRADGKRFPKDVRRIAKSAGKAGGLELNKGFTDALSKLGRELGDDMNEHGEFAGISFTDSFRNSLRSRASGISDELAKVFSRSSGLDDYAKRVGGVEPALESLREKMRELNEVGGLNEKMWNRLGGTLNQWAGGARKAEAEANALADAQERSRKQLEEMNRAHGEALVMNRQINADNKRMAAAQARAVQQAERLAAREQRLAQTRANSSKGLARYADDTDDASESNSRFGNGLSHNTRQVIFWSSAIAAASGNMAVLGSAAGSSLAVLAGAALAAGTGIGVAVAGFQGMLGELSEIEPAARPAAIALKELGTGFSAIQDVIQGKMFEGLEGPLQRIGDTLLPVLSVGFGQVAEGVNQFFKNFAGAITSETALTGFRDLFATMEPTIVALGNAAIGLGGALGGIFVAAAPFVQVFAVQFADLMGRFNDWVQSVEGQSALTTFFEHGQQVIGPFMDLLGALGPMLASLVTPETVQMTVDFINNLTEFMPVLGQILGVVTELDVFGVLSELLLAVGAAITPIIPSLTALAQLISEFLVQAFATLAPMIAQVLLQVMPLVIVLAQQLLPVFIALAPVIMDLITAVLPPLVSILMAVVPAILPIVQAITALLIPAIGFLVPAFESAGRILTLVASIITNVVMGVLKALGQALSGDLVGSIKTLSQMWNSIWQSIVRFLDGAVKQAVRLVRDMAQGILDWFRGLPSGVQDFLGRIPKIAQDAFGGIANFARDAVNNAVDFFAKLPGRILNAVGNIGAQIAKRLSFDIPGIPGFATGGIITRDGIIRAGEGNRPEAIVPLTGPLSAVDPDVRELSAIARGMKTASSGSGTSGPSKQIIVEEGAIQVITPSSNPEQVASSMLDRLVQAF